MKPLDDPFYYLANFQVVLDWISSRYDDLLVDSERAFIRQFTDLPRASRALLVRMIMRKGELFRTSRLHYQEIGSVEAAVQPLVTQGWVDPDPELSLDALFKLFTRSELQLRLQHEKNWPIGRSARKAEILE